MPEGPEIRRAADKISSAISNRTTTSVSFGLAHLKRFESLLTKQRVVSVTSHGKAILTRFANGYSIYSHNQLYGRWYITKSGELPEVSRQLRLAIHNKEFSALLYSASEIEFLNQAEVSQHSFLSRIGPDILDNATSTEQVLERLSSKEFYRRCLGNLLTDQAFLAGLGNYLRCEILFMTGLSPSKRPCDCSHSDLLLLADNILLITKQSYETAGITNDLERAKRLKEKGLEFEQYRFNVFRRGGEECYKCGTTIQKIKSGSQPCYLCPTCQKDE